MYDISKEKFVSKWLLKGDLQNVLVLTLLYCLQGIPLGLAYASLPFLLKKHLSYSDLGIFSISTFPFSLKFLWSPLVDAYFIPQFGRRKTWIVPLQIISGLMMMILSYACDDMIVDPSQIYNLTYIFTLIVFVYATQDIAVDGWALEILMPEHKSLASTSQSVGQNLGFFMSFTIFLALNSSGFCNTYIFSDEQDRGLIELSGFLYFWGVINLLTSAYLIIFTREKPLKFHDPKSGFISIFSKIYKTVKQSHFKWLILLALTKGIFFASSDAMFGLMLMEKGLPEADLGLLAVFQLPIDILLSMIIGWYTRHGNQFTYFCFGFLIRSFMCVYGMLILINYDDTATFYGFLILGSVISSLGSNCVFVSICSFFNSIADESIGGSMLTFLYTLWNFGGTWPKMVVLSVVEYFTIPGICESTGLVCKNDCIGTCEGMIHGFYIVTSISVVLAVIYYPFLRHVTKKLEKLSPNEWKIKVSKN